MDGTGTRESHSHTQTRVKRDEIVAPAFPPTDRISGGADGRKGTDNCLSRLKFSRETLDYARDDRIAHNKQ